MPSHGSLSGDLRSSTRRAASFCVILLAISLGARAQNSAAKKSPPREQKAARLRRAFLSPRDLFPEIHSATKCNLRPRPIRLDPASLPIRRARPAWWWIGTRPCAWKFCPPIPARQGGGIRLRTTYEKSTATVGSDTFDPAAAETQEQYHKLEGKVVEFTLDADGKVKSVLGLEGIVDSEKAAQSARDWIAHLSASAGAPPGGVSLGQTWSSQQPADTLPIAGLVWRTDSHYLRNESCRPVNSDVPTAPPPAESRNECTDEFSGSTRLRRDPRDLKFSSLKVGPAT